MAELPAGTDPHSVSWCNCCTEAHHHGEAVLPAEQCQAQNHPGVPCHGHVLGAPRPDGCTVCRPVIHYAVAGEIQFTAGA